MKNQHLLNDVLNALLAMEIKEESAMLIATTLMDKCDSEEDIIKAINSFGDIRGTIV